ncbi:peptidoglycan glycosyltransferase FtsW [Novosphingobium aquimarinum]|uniref:peptidoglycan glycosyltransferase FtsW n=1 Tax=Novosphingobium aquimarinum TaxID=2682494 RepID=UPI0012EB9C60|nr:putative peptidoglycan glycosyltransferase FtsW [Novosphingobium aquimarinum]
MATQAPPSGFQPTHRSLPPAHYRRGRRNSLQIWWQEIDRGVLLLAVILMVIGSVSVAAGSPASARRLSTSSKSLDDLHFFYLHLRWQIVALAAMLAASTLRKDVARRLGILLACSMILALALVPFLGFEVNGARRWLNLGLSLQPSSFLKCGFPILLGWLLSLKVRDEELPMLGVTFLILALVAGLLMLQPDFGTTILLCGTWFVLVLLTGIDMRRITIAGVGGVIGVIVTYFFYENAQRRIDSFLGGGSAFDQVDLAKKTLLNGGWMGRGFWMGERKLALPEAHTDYIFSVIGEEFGLLACAVVVVLYIVLVLRIILRQMREEDLFTVYAATGFAAQIGGQAFINILVNLQLFPSKGMTLPLISYGGSSTLATGITIGLLLAITRRNPFIQGERLVLSELGDSR